MLGTRRAGPPEQPEGPLGRPDRRARQPVLHYGIPDRLIQHGEREDMLEDAELTADHILRFIQRHMSLLGITETARRA